jgi:hypothetical protein
MKGVYQFNIEGVVEGSHDDSNQLQQALQIKSLVSVVIWVATRIPNQMCLDSHAMRIRNTSFGRSNVRPKENKLTMVNLSHNQQDGRTVRFVCQKFKLTSINV